MDPAPPIPEAAAADARRRRRQGMVLLGLLLSFAGLFLVSVLLPTGTDALDRAIPVVGAGLLCLWIGGILLGRSAGTRSRTGGRA